MSNILLTQSETFIIGPVATLLGYLMDGIFKVLNFIGIPNIGLSIIIFTIAIYLLMMPLTIKQQKFSKLNAKMSPELQAIQAKYKGKKDNDSAMAMNQETQAVYAKYGVSPTGSCLQMLIQMPILFSLYKVIGQMPAYVTQIKEAFFPLVDKLISQPGSAEFVQGFKNSAMYTKQFTNELFVGGNVEYVQNTFIDVLNKASTAELTSLATQFPSISTDISNTMGKLNEYNNFFGLNMGNSPSFIVSEAFAAGAWLMIVAAFAIPVLSAVTQWLNVKLMPQVDSGNGENPMANSMKTMNLMMPIMSAFFCYTLPTGMGVYWIAGSVVRSIQQIAINKHMDKIDIEELIKKNVEKNNKKRQKAGLPPQTLNSNAKINTRTVATTKVVEKSREEREEAIKKATEFYSKNAKQGSIASKANMVKQFNEKNNK